MIVQSHRELRCPECRVLVDMKIDELPPNVLLMRILEGMKNASSSHQMLMRKSQKNSQNFLEGNLINLHHHHHHHQQSHRVGGSLLAVDSPPPPITPGLQQTTQKFVAGGANPVGVKSSGGIVPIPGGPMQNQKDQIKRPNNPFPLASIPHARALYDFVSKEVGDLNFKIGDVIIMRKLLDQNWCIGEVNGREGAFPLNHVDVINPLPVPQSKALYNFRMGPNEEEGCLIFNKGAIIQVLRRVDQNWAEGKIGEVIGIFPIAFVEMNMTARHLMDTSAKAVTQNGGASRVVPPKPFDNILSSDSSSTSTTTTPNSGSSSNTSSNSSTAPNSPTTNLTNGESTDNKEKRHSLIPVITSSSNQVAADAFVSTNSSPIPKGSGHHEKTPLTQQQRAKLVQQRFNRFPAMCEAIYSYKPLNPDELELKKGAQYYVTERCQDGWLKGSNRAKKSGVFPGNYVIPLTKNRGGGAEGSASSHQKHSNIPGGESSVNSDHPSHPPELPPRNITPPPSSSSQQGGGGGGWTKHLTNVDHLFAKKSSKDINHGAQAASPASAAAVKSDKKESSSSSAVSLMKRLTHIKQSKSPSQPSTAFSIDNPVFEDTVSQPVSGKPSTSKHSIQVIQPIHVRSGSCPSQLLQNISFDLGLNSSSGESGMAFAFGGSKRIKAHGKERPSLQEYEFHNIFFVKCLMINFVLFTFNFLSMRLNVENVTTTSSKQKHSVQEVGSGHVLVPKQPGPSGVHQVMTSSSSGGRNPYHRKTQSLDATQSPIPTSHHDPTATVASSKNKSSSQIRER